MSAQPQLDKVLTIPEVAAIAGWDRRRMLRHLLKVDAEIGGMLLRNVGSKAKPRWTVTLRALRGVAPQWFTDPESLMARLEALESETKQHKRLIASLAESLVQITKAA